VRSSTLQFRGELLRLGIAAETGVALQERWRSDKSFWAARDWKTLRNRTPCWFYQNSLPDFADHSASCLYTGSI